MYKTQVAIRQQELLDEVARLQTLNKQLSANSNTRSVASTAINASSQEYTHTLFRKLTTLATKPLESSLQLPSMLRVWSTHLRSFRNLTTLAKGGDPAPLCLHSDVIVCH